MGTGTLYGAPRIVERRYRTLVVLLVVAGVAAGSSYSARIPSTQSADAQILLPMAASGAPATSTEIGRQVAIGIGDGSRDRIYALGHRHRTLYQKGVLTYRYAVITYLPIG